MDESLQTFLSDQSQWKVPGGVTLTHLSIVQANPSLQPEALTQLGPRLAQNWVAAGIQDWLKILDLS